MPRPQEVGATSSSVPDTEATSATPVGWIHGGGTSALNLASLYVQAKLRAEAKDLRRCNEAFLESRAAIRVSFPYFPFPFILDLLAFFMGARQRTHWV